MSEQISGANHSSLAGSGDDVSPDAIAGRIDSLKMASSFDNNDSSGSGDGVESAGPSRSESPSNAPEAAKVSPPAGGTQSTLLQDVQQIHSTPTASGISLDLSDVMGSGPGLPFRTNHRGGAAAGATASTHSASTTRPPMLHELTPVIRNTSGSGEDLGAGFAASNIVSPEGARNGGPMLELSIPPRTGAGTGGGMAQLPPRVSALPMRTDQSSSTATSSSSSASTPRPSASAIASTTAAGQSNKQHHQQQKPPPIPQAQRSYSAGNLDSESLVKTVREYYSTPQQTGGATVEPKGLADEFDLAMKQEAAEHTSQAPTSVDSQTASELALAQRQVQSEAYLRRRKESEAEHDKNMDTNDPNSTENRAQLAIERALASVGSGPAAPIDEANVNQAIQNAVQDVTGGTVSGFDASGLFRIPQGPPPGPPIPLSSPERRVQSFDRRNVSSSGKHLPGSPRPTTSAIPPSSSASPGRSGLPPLPGSTGPASQYLQPEQSVFASVEKPQYQPTRDTSLTDIGKVGDPGLDSIFKEGRPAKMHSPKRPAPGSHSQQIQMQGIFQAQPLGQGGQLPPQIQAPDSPSLRNPIPLEQRDWSIPSIRMAHHVNSGESCTTVETYDDDTLGEEDDIGGGGGGGDFDDATLSSRGSTPQEMKSSVDVLAEIDVSIGGDDDGRKPSADQDGPITGTSTQVVIEQGMEAVTHKADDAIVGAADSVHAIAAPPGVFHTEGGHKKRHRKNRKSEEAFDWLKSVEIGGVAEAASSKFLTGNAPPTAATGAGIGLSVSTGGSARPSEDAERQDPSQGTIPGALKPNPANRQTSLPENMNQK